MPEKKPEPENETKPEPELTPARKQAPEGVWLFFFLLNKHFGEDEVDKKIYFFSFSLFAFFENRFGRESEVHEVNESSFFIIFF